MKQYAVVAIATLIGSTFSNRAAAGEYDYEIGLSYGNSSTDTLAPLYVIGGDPSSTFGTSVSSADSDSLELAGTWYYSPLSDASGPKSRAAFLSRASSVSLAYSYDDESSSFSSTGVISPPLPPGLPPVLPLNGSGDSTRRELEANLRHVWQSSGWYGLAGATRFEAVFDNVISNGLSFSSEIDGTAYYAGVGKYIGDATALDLKVISSDLDGFDSTGYALSLSHVGSIGSRWRYAADIGYSMSDSDVNDNDGSYTAGLSLFPTDNFEFGVRLAHQESEFSSDRDSYEGFVGWFVRDHIEVRARYRDNDIDENFVSDIDSNQFGIGVNVRF